jgi:hypothetical protein
MGTLFESLESPCAHSTSLVTRDLHVQAEDGRSPYGPSCPLLWLGGCLVGPYGSLACTPWNKVSLGSREPFNPYAARVATSDSWGFLHLDHRWWCFSPFDAY